jgi:hypothetical protein
MVSSLQDFQLEFFIHFSMLPYFAHIIVDLITIIIYGETLKLWSHLGFEVFTAVVMKSIIFWDMTPCNVGYNSTDYTTPYPRR